MDRRPLFQVRDRPSQDFMGKWRNVSLAEQDEPRKVLQWIAFAPSEVGMWLLASAITHRNQHRSNGIGDRRAVHSKDSVPFDHFSPNPKRLREIRSILHTHFQKDNWGACRYLVRLALLSLLDKVIP